MLLNFVVAATVLSPNTALADWKPVERVEAYSISGSTGIELYRSIGERGPKLGIRRVIAYTDFKLTWQRDYQQRNDGACVLASAKPKLIITYRLPQVSGTLSPQTQAAWDRFSEGVREHERVHGEIITDMVKEIETVSVGLRAESDPGCRKVRTKLQEHLGRLSQAQRRRSREFDRVEMGDGGNVHRLVMEFINADRQRSN
ncbi:DUF922 domain-containing protein [uncultured Nitratireductor sp.]|uniref:DUF922 domain-containing Zn-dependent protease n=1 Tax=uncultured Nitratireductor sp. TaxID=520953 RepID=UPI0025D8DA68|nr:DUF922 domain-containing protein [uncultured Nitratireductor sp.]